MQNSEADREVIATLKSGSEEAFADFFFSHQERLLRIVKFRLDFRLGGRISASGSKSSFEGPNTCLIRLAGPRLHTSLAGESVVLLLHGDLTKGDLLEVFL